MAEIRNLDQIGPDDGPLVGGKALSLAMLARAGLPMPPGFCLGSDAYGRWNGCAPRAVPELTQLVTDAYRRLGEGPVAVRSSSTSEDGRLVSFAGQHATLLGVVGAEAVLDAIGRCWTSLDSERVRAYRRKQGHQERDQAMAVVVQRLVPAEVAGVLFTQDPLDPEGRRMLVEASWGLGESVVSGKVTPDRYYLDAATGVVLERHVAHKPTMVTPTGPAPVPPERRDQSCLDAASLSELAALGRRVVEVFGGPRDVEWAWAEGRFWLLQARGITAISAAERAQVRREEIAELKSRAEPGGTVWSRYNLAEILPEPTPMTWSIVRRFLSGRGGLGLMYRDLGFDPDPALDADGIYDLVCGRPFCNLSREPRLLFRHLPLVHSFETLKAAPHLALYPQPVLRPAGAGPQFWFSLPLLLAKMIRSSYRVSRFRRTFPRRFREGITPALVAEAHREAARDLTPLTPPELMHLLETWIQRTLYEFARDSLKPTALAGVALGNLEKVLRARLGPERAQAALAELCAGARPDPEADLAASVQALTAGRLDRATFLDQFGHRGGLEMELAQPRWAEDPTGLDQLIRQIARAGQQESKEHAPASEAAWERIVAEARLRPRQKTALRQQLSELVCFLGLRETAKHHLMRGYALIRKLLVEIDRRYGLEGAIFYLVLEELSRLVSNEDMSAVIARRRRRHAAALGLEVPQVLYSDDLEAIGRMAEPPGNAAFQGVPLSAGVAEGPALVLAEPPTEDLPDDPYILVCPTTDPAWVPLFARARGLVLETGGILSHGAIVAREFDLPAVAGFPGIHQRLRTGQRLRVDGRAGTVSVVGLPEAGR